MFLPSLEAMQIHKKCTNNLLGGQNFANVPTAMAEGLL